MDYVRTLPIKRWSAEQVNAYLKNKGIDNVSLTGQVISTMKLSTFRRTYGLELGDQLYLVIRDRVEREEELVSKKLSESPLMRQPISMPPTPKLSGVSASSQMTNIMPSPLSSFPHNPLPSSNVLAMSNLDLNAPLDFKQTDARAREYFDELLNKQLIARQIIATREYDKFIAKYPPLLWQQYHLHRFLETINIRDFDIPVDDFIFYSADELEKIYPNKGLHIYDAIRSRFVNPRISKIKPAPKSL